MKIDNMKAENFSEIVKAATLASLKKTEARSSAAAVYARNNIKDVLQSVALEVLERINDGEIFNIQLATRAANCVITREYRKYKKWNDRTTQETTQGNDGKEINVFEVEQRTKIKQNRLEEKTLAAETLKNIYNALPPVYRKDAPEIIKYIAFGYTEKETANKLNCSEKRIHRILKATRATAKKIITEV